MSTQIGGPITLPRNITVRELSELLKSSPIEVIKELMKSGIMASINQSIDYGAAAAVASEFGYEPQPETATATETVAVQEEAEEQEQEANLQPRPPIVTILGHVDHGKTSLLDVIRQTNVTDQEVGAITQHIGAYQAEINGQKITFIDTPGHEAFTALRARGASITDIAILVVAADDGVMPQTVEAIHHSKAAGVPIVVALNKSDLPDINPDRVKQQLTEHEVVIEEYGGDVIAIPVSAKTKEGLQDLLEHVILVAEISELKANPDRSAEGVIIETVKDPARGPMATIIVQKGTLRVGDVVVTSTTCGKIKALFNENGERVSEALPSTPIEILGLDAVPHAGDTITVSPDERIARETLEARERQRAAEGQAPALTLEAVSEDVAADRQVRDLNIILKADVQGSLEAIHTSLKQLSVGTVHLKLIHAAIGNVSESDVMLARASKGLIVSFNVRVEPGGRRLAESNNVDIRRYQIIHELIEDIEKAVNGLIEPEIVEVVDGHAEVRAVFKIRGGRIAGCYLTNGIVRRNSMLRLLRDDEVIHSSRVSSLRRLKDDVREVTAGFECGIGIERFTALKEGDILEAFHSEQKG